MYQELYAISKMQMAQKNFAKWNNYSVKIDESLLDNIKKFVPIDGSNKTSAKAYRLTKNKFSTGVFCENRNDQFENNQINLQDE